MAGFRWTVDRSQFVKAAVRAAAAQGLSDGAELILEETVRTIPIEEATLARSGTTSLDAARLRATVAFDTPYAVRQHEDLTLRHDPGRRAKFLELTMAEQARKVGQVIQTRVKAVL